MIHEKYHQSIERILCFLDETGIACTVERFPSGAVMIDFDLKGRYFCLQITQDYFGYSEITEDDPGFSTLPSFAFSKEDEFLEGLRKFLGL